MALDQTISFKKIQGDCNARAPHTEHDGKKFMRDAQLFQIKPIMGHQEPTRQPIFELAPAICHRGVGRLDVEGVSIEEKSILQATASLDCAPELGRSNSRSFTSILNVCFVGRAIRS
jgi:hypothetical protein